jgi:hypothetical protein
MSGVPRPGLTLEAKNTFVQELLGEAVLKEKRLFKKAIYTSACVNYNERETLPLSRIRVRNV